jgi:hypothetical protein
VIERGLGGSGRQNKACGACDGAIDDGVVFHNLIAVVV